MNGVIAAWNIQFILLIAGLSPRFQAEPSSLTARLGGTAFFPCSVESVPAGSASVSWLLDDQPLRMDHRMTTLPSGALVVQDVGLADRGSYRCRVSLAGEGLGGGVEETRVSRSAALKIDPGKLSSLRVCTREKVRVPFSFSCARGLLLLIL